MSIVKGMLPMDEAKKKLISEHVRLTTQLISGNLGAKHRLEQIEAELQMDPDDIARAAMTEYLKDYNR